MTGLSVLAAGALVDVRHALEPDHLAAVATLVDEDAGRAGVVGASWGVGHALPVVALGLGFLGIGVELPAAVTTLFEALVGVVLLVAAAPSPGAALGLLAGFCALSILTMAGVAVAWGRALGTAAPRYLGTAAGLFGVALGAAILAEQIAVVVVL